MARTKARTPLDDPEPTTRAEIAEAITWACQAAKREFPKVGTADFPTPWDKRHELLNDLIAEYVQAPA